MPKRGSMAGSLSNKPHPVDELVGRRLRLCRKERGFSQAYLGERLGLTFQQIQKYERGSNRISASKLWEAASVLEVPVSSLFHGLEARAMTRQGGRIARADSVIADLMADRNGLVLAEAFLAIRHPGIRQRLVNLVREIAASDPDVA